MFIALEVLFGVLVLLGIGSTFGYHLAKTKFEAKIERLTTQFNDQGAKNLLLEEDNKNLRAQVSFGNKLLEGKQDP